MIVTVTVNIIIHLPIYSRIYISIIIYYNNIWFIQVLIANIIHSWKKVLKLNNDDCKGIDAAI